MKEEWKDICGGSYSVSNLGKIKSNRRKVSCRGNKKRWIREKILSPGFNDGGYYRVNLGRANGGARLLHRLIAEAFIPNPGNLETVNHKDLNKTNNAVTNLEWATSSDNVKHGWENGAYSSLLRPVKCVNTGAVYSGVLEAAAAMNREAGNLCSHLKGRQASFAGAQWAYLDD